MDKGMASNSDTGKSDLIAGIKKDAQIEADKIIADAKKIVEQRRAAGERQVAAILKDAKQKAQEQVEAIKKNMSSTISVETRRISLRVRDMVIHKTLKYVQDKLESMMGKPGYRQVLIEWIVEASIGLNAREAEINLSAKELPFFEDNILPEAEAKIKELTGRTVILTKSQDNPLLAQGVVLTAKNKRVAFNNQVPTRLLRYQSEIRKIIYDELPPGVE